MGRERFAAEKKQCREEGEQNGFQRGVKIGFARGEQSGFAKLFNKICDSEPYANLGWHGDTGEEIPEGVFKGGKY